MNIHSGEQGSREASYLHGDIDAWCDIALRPMPVVRIDGVSLPAEPPQDGVVANPFSDGGFRRCVAACVRRLQLRLAADGAAGHGRFDEAFARMIDGPTLLMEDDLRGLTTVASLGLRELYFYGRYAMVEQVSGRVKDATRRDPPAEFAHRVPPLLPLLRAAFGNPYRPIVYECDDCRRFGRWCGTFKGDMPLQPQASGRCGLAWKVGEWSVAPGDASAGGGGASVAGWGTKSLPVKLVGTGKVGVNPAWVSDDVRRLTAQLYERPGSDVGCVLADALEDAGCTDELILMPLRGAQPAVPFGCRCDGTNRTWEVPRRGEVSRYGDAPCVCRGVPAWTGPVVVPFRGMYVLDLLRHAAAARDRAGEVGE